MEADKNKDGAINFDEFEALMRERMRDGDWVEVLELHSDEQVDSAFQRCCQALARSALVATSNTERKKHTSLSRTELQLAMAHVYIKEDKSDGEIANVARWMMASARSELNKNGRLSFEEFKGAFLGKAELHPVQSKMMADWDLEVVVRSMRAWVSSLAQSLFACDDWYVLTDCV